MTDKLFVLEATSGSVLVLKPSEEQIRIFESEYNEDTEAWLCGEGIDDKIHIDVSNCSFLWVNGDETPVEIPV